MYPFLALIWPLVSAAAAVSFHNGTLIDESQLPIRSDWGHTRTQFPIACFGCFEAPEGTAEDGYLVFDFRISRRWGIDGEDACILNGQYVAESDFDKVDKEAYVDAERLFDDSGAISIYPVGELQYRTLISNATHDIKAVSFTLDHMQGKPQIYPRKPAGFVLSYARRPSPQILRIQQTPTEIPAFAHLDEWINPKPGHRFNSAMYSPIDATHDDYGGFDYYWMECKTIPCHVNRLYELMKKAHGDCVERVEHPEFWEEERGKVPLHCRVYLVNPQVAAFASVLVVLMAITIFRRRRFWYAWGRTRGEGHRARYATRTQITKDKV